jgi:hypothetical protein
MYLLTDLNDSDYIDHVLDLTPGDDEPEDDATTRWWDAVSFRAWQMDGAL